ncbi:hypothetical protein [Rhizohabitans arisaemae]|uniref:hypothetical protein n=1 Tax=Rhizohabitans arisaemae TaxID=2720610 RepID=UPI0024B265A4|nr:hypothetical protein [Rhizohabitans arisaemae]
MTRTDSAPGTRLAGALLLISLVALLAAVAIVVPSGLTLNPEDPAAALAAVSGKVGLHLGELAFDVAGWSAMTAAGLLIAGSVPASRPHVAVLAGGLLACAGLAGVLHNAGNLAVTQLAGDPAAEGTVRAVLLTAKWGVNLAGLLWVAATVAAVAGLRMSRAMRRAGGLAVVCGLAAVVLPWTTGTEGLPGAVEQLGYALQLPVMAWYGLLGFRYLRGREHPGNGEERVRRPGVH